MGKGYVYTAFYLRERVHFGDPGVDGRIIIRLNIRYSGVWVWAGSRWLKIAKGGGHL